jgi:hypothetical protein
VRAGLTRVDIRDELLQGPGVLEVE